MKVEKNQPLRPMLLRVKRPHDSTFIPKLFRMLDIVSFFCSGSDFFALTKGDNLI